MKKNNTDKKRIYNEWMWLYANYTKFDLISDVKSPSIFTSTIGQKFEHFKLSSYKKKYDDAIENENYSIYLNDDSIISYYYIFDHNGKVIGHNLAYIPSPYNDTIPYSDTMSAARYLRADYDKTGYKSIIHTLVHLHIGIYDTKFRIPIAHYLSPCDFLYIILKYTYHSEQDIVDKLIQKKQKECLLSNEEMCKLRIIFGE